MTSCLIVTGAKAGFAFAYCLMVATRKQQTFGFELDAGVRHHIL